MLGENKQTKQIKPELRVFQIPQGTGDSDIRYNKTPATLSS